MADQTLEQALLNLLNNAADASPDGFEVAGPHGDGDVVIDILDRGPGLTDEVQARAGELFFSTKAPEGGMGIGLFLANATIERFGGSVSLFNRPGGGCCTRVTLPLADVWPEARPRMSEFVRRAGLLIVDDDLTFCRVLARAMEGRGFAVSVAHDVLGGLRSAGAGIRPSYAVVDLRMPGPSGLDLGARRCSELDAQSSIVVLTGYASIATAVEAIKIGATHYLAKPANAEEIIAAFGRTSADAEVDVRDPPGRSAASSGNTSRRC